MPVLTSTSERQSLRARLHWHQTYCACAQRKLDTVQLQLRHQHRQPALWWGMKGTTEDESTSTTSEPPSLTSRAPGMLFLQNISPVHPNLWEHYNSNKTCLSSFLTPSQHQLSSPFLGRLVMEMGAPESQVSKAWQPGPSLSTSYVPCRMQWEVSPCRSHIPGGIPGAWRIIFSSTMKRFL